MTSEEYEKYVWSKINTPIECSYLGLAGEVGELLDLIKKIEYHGHTETVEVNKKLLNEAGDILFYLTDICQRRLDCTLEEIMLANKEKLDARYAGKFTKEESINRSKCSCLNGCKAPDCDKI